MYRTQSRTWRCHSLLLPTVFPRGKDSGLHKSLSIIRIDPQSGVLAHLCEVALVPHHWATLTPNDWRTKRLLHKSGNASAVENEAWHVRNTCITICVKFWSLRRSKYYIPFQREEPHFSITVLCNTFFYLYILLRIYWYIRYHEYSESRNFQFIFKVLWMVF